MTLFIYHEKKLYADKRKVVNLPDGKIITPLIESKVVKKPWCYLAIAGIKSHETSFYFKHVTMLESLKFVIDKTNALKHNSLKNSLLDYEKFLILLEDTLHCICNNPIYETTHFTAVTKRNVWMSGCHEYQKEMHQYSLNDICAMGSGAETAEILMMNSIHPQEIYPIVRRAGIPTGEEFEVFDIHNLKDLEPPYQNNNVWIFAYCYLATSRTLLSPVDMATAMTYITLFSGRKNSATNIFTPKMFDRIDKFVYDYHHDKDYQDYPFYKSFLKMAQEQTQQD